MSLHHKSLLVSLTLSGIASTRADKQITSQVLLDTHAAADAGRWLARLWPKEALDPIRQLDGRIRAFHYQKTLPWLDKGERIIASRIFSDYLDEIRSFRQQRHDLAADFLANYDDWIHRASIMRGTAFKLDEYPTREAARRRFSMELTSQPIPHRDDFRITLAQGDLSSVQEELEARVAQAEAQARRDLYRRAAEPVSRLIERLADPAARFTESSLNALREVVNALPDLNVLDDPEIESLADRIRTQLCRLDPTGLAESRTDRSIALNSANSILATMAPWLDAETEEEAAA